MPFYKYFRPNMFFEKAVKYNEIYFSANHELNDPHDLKAKYYFEDSICLWAKLLTLPPFSSWDISRYIDPTCEVVIAKLNALFRGAEIDSNDESIKKLVENYHDRLTAIFSQALRSEISPPDGMDFLKDVPPEQLSRICELCLTELLARAVNHRFYSASFSATALSPMMWAHYADGFKGCVIIYASHDNGTIDLRTHLRAEKAYKYSFSEINYIDDEKRIPILRCAISGKDSAIQAFLQKNSFWDYEKEFRLLVAEESKTHMLASVEQPRYSNREKIFYHEADSILGVIFGPRCPENLRNKVEHSIRDNRFYGSKKPFYLFDAEFKHDGAIEIAAASKILCEDLSGIKRQYKENSLEALLSELSIK